MIQVNIIRKDPHKTEIILRETSTEFKNLDIMIDANCLVVTCMHNAAIIPLEVIPIGEISRVICRPL
jgi:hypothetical protein